MLFPNKYYRVGLQKDREVKARPLWSSGLRNPGSGSSTLKYDHMVVPVSRGPRILVCMGHDDLCVWVSK